MLGEGEEKCPYLCIVVPTQPHQWCLLQYFIMGGRCSPLFPHPWKCDRRFTSARFHGCDLHIPVFSPSEGRTATMEPAPGVKSVELSPLETQLDLFAPTAGNGSPGSAAPSEQRSLSASLVWAPHSTLLPTKKQQQQQKNPSLKLETGASFTATWSWTQAGMESQEKTRPSVEQPPAHPMTNQPSASFAGCSSPLQPTGYEGYKYKTPPASPGSRGGFV